jgi:hypothetical protein
MNIVQPEASWIFRFIPRLYPVERQDDGLSQHHTFRERK